MATYFPFFGRAAAMPRSCLLLLMVAMADATGCGKTRPLPAGKIIERTVHVPGGAGPSGESLERKYVIRLPAFYSPEQEHPLLLYFHGWGGDAKVIAEHDGLGSLSNKQGWITVHAVGMSDVKEHPDLGKRFQWTSWNGSGTVASPGPAGPICDKKADWTPCYASCGKCKDHCWWTTCADDVAFVRALLDELESTLCIDTKRIVASGFSNGGIFLYELVKHEAVSKRLAAIIPVAGLPHIGFNHPPASPVKLLGLWGRKDKEVPGFHHETSYAAPANGATVSQDGFYYTPLSDVLKVWGGADGLGNVLAEDFPTHLDGARGLSCKAFKAAVGPDEVNVAPTAVACTWDGPHAWPGYDYFIPEERGELLATALIVEVFLRKLTFWQKEAAGYRSSLRAPPRSEGFKTSLGPGSGRWTKVEPEAAGLSTAALDAAAARVEKKMPVRQCWAVFRHGALVHEAYYDGALPATNYEVDSASKTATALVMGVAWTMGLFDLDKPLVEYGVSPDDTWTDDPNHWFPRLTARHLLSQSSGRGMLPPGQNFTYDSDDAIQHLERLLAKVIGSEETTQWATDHFAVPLGIPDLFVNDGPQFSAGGGQLVTCRDMGRLGQIILNSGTWLRSDGSSFQLISKEYMAMMTTASMPHLTPAYGLLLWLWNPPANKEMVYPRWGITPGCTEFEHGESNLYDLDRTAYTAMGWLAKFFMVFPEDGTVVVTIGNTLFGSAECDVRFGPFGMNLDDSYSMYSFWGEIRDAMPPRFSPASTAAIDTPASLVARSTTAGHGASPPSYVDMPRRPKANRKRRRHQRRRRLLQNSTSPTARGSCTCNCPIWQGFGSCSVAPPGATGDADCAKFGPVAATRCPIIGVVQECRVKDIQLLRDTMGKINVVNPCENFANGQHNLSVRLMKSSGCLKT
eukprot:TRINITY_DN24312_c0_g1_i2.p1 TRINITY_DN24312_c0_g1~~TRINITY_DN24312_c0_g1_i2.p1  ORF type:complete len:912 (-),score=131.97 TRINITY_DN24312_c0_g1_i2:120-2855(-)